MNRLIITLIIIISFSLYGCMKCELYYEIEDIGDSNSMKMILLGGGNDVRLSFGYFNKEKNLIIEDVKISLFDSENNMINFKKEFAFNTGGCDELFIHESTVGFKEFYDIPLKYRSPYYDICNMEFEISSIIDSKDFVAVFNTDIKDSAGNVIHYQNKFKVKVKNNCNFHFAFH